MTLSQEFFDPDNFNSKEECLKAKKIRIKELRAKGYKVNSSILKNQQRSYSGLGSVRDCSERNVYMINIYS